MSTVEFRKSIHDSTHTGGRLTIAVTSEGLRFIQTAKSSGDGWWIGLTEEEAVELVGMLAETMNRDSILQAVKAMAVVMKDKD